jgi:hypothetical protein
MKPAGDVANRAMPLRERGLSTSVVPVLYVPRENGWTSDV